MGSAAPKMLTGDDLVKRYHDCRADWVSGKWDDFKSCYASDAVWEAPGTKMGPINGAAAIVELDKSFRVAFPNENAESQFVLVNGKKIVDIALLTGKQTGTLKLPTHDLPATNNQFGVYAGQVLAIDDSGKISHESDFEDMATMLGQLKPKKDHAVRPVVAKLTMPEQVAIAKDDAHEKANLASFQQLSDAFNKHDLKAFSAVLADNVVWSEQAMSKDQSKKDLATSMPEMWKAFSDLKLTVGDAWAAGDYVAATETFEGTNDGDLPSMHLKKTGKKVSLPFLAIDKLDAGKVTAAWIFYQGGGFANQLGVDTKLSKN
ncbi:MAG TPA: nuclear transport factor 2 family protein [Kofleriaceae bacterium]|nr:nuclear transport factor 2 family protein [Kofleriaceae bacterium]